MSGFNRKGPQGDGAMTGRRMGRCMQTEENSSRKPLIKGNQEFENDADNFDLTFGFGRRNGQRRRGSWSRGFKNR